jgi:uncharacterized protein YecE (DUF72 family)
MELWVGTSGYAYPQWKGGFYPEGLPAREFLRYYGTRLAAVEINNTFYRMPKASVLAAWAEQVPEGFRFVLKAPQRITHIKRLKDAGEEVGYLLRTSETLGERLGPLLFQTPPNLKQDLGRLESFLDLFIDEAPPAFEFRHPSWQDEPVLALLRARGCALCVADTDEAPAAEVSVTARWGYLRLRRALYEDAALAAWAARVAATGWERAYVFFKHEDEPTGPRYAERFRELAADRRRQPG